MLCLTSLQPHRMSLVVRHGWHVLQKFRKLPQFISMEREVIKERVFSLASQIFAESANHAILLTLVKNPEQLKYRERRSEFCVF